MQSSPSLSRHWGAVVGAALVPIVTVAAGLSLGVLILRVPLDLSPIVVLGPIAFVVVGIILLAQLWSNGFRPPHPLPLAGAFLIAYALVLVVALPRFEEAKPVKRLAREIAARGVEPNSVATYHMQRWNPSWRFYVRQTVRLLETPADVDSFMREPARRLCLMLRSDYEELTTLGIKMQVVSERSGLFVTSGRALRRGRRDAWRSFVVVSNRFNDTKEH